VSLHEFQTYLNTKQLEGKQNVVYMKCGNRFHIDFPLRDHEKLCGNILKGSMELSFQV
jgi:hypothetical protein